MKSTEKTVISKITEGIVDKLDLTSQKPPMNEKNVLNHYHLLRVLAELVTSFPNSGYLLIRKKNFIQTSLNQLLVTKLGTKAVELQYILGNDQLDGKSGDRVLNVGLNSNLSFQGSFGTGYQLNGSANSSPQESVNMLTYKERTWARPLLLLLAALASSPVPEVQHRIANELCKCFKRIKKLPEGIEKHVQLRAILGLIHTIANMTMPKLPKSSTRDRLNPKNLKIPLSQVQTCFPGILLKKGILVELARLPLVLKLDSPCFQSTMNINLSTGWFFCLGKIG